MFTVDYIFASLRLVLKLSSSGIQALYKEE